MAVHSKKKKLARRAEPSKAASTPKTKAEQRSLRKGTGLARTALEKADEERAGQ